MTSKSTWLPATDWARFFATSAAVGTRWFKVDLHVHTKGLQPTDIVSAARQQHIDVLAITEHQSFGAFAQVNAAAQTSGRALTVLPGIEVTSQEGVHLLAVFPADLAADLQLRFLGWLELTNIGDTTDASRQNIDDILLKVEQEGGVAIVPHPFSTKTGLLDSARKMGTKLRWLESGLIRLIQTAEDKLRYIGVDEHDTWMNRFVLKSATSAQVAASHYFLAPFNTSDCHSLADIGEHASWFRMSEPSVDGLKQVACEPKTRISRTEPALASHSTILSLRVLGGYCDRQEFRFSQELTSIIGPNYAGKSAVFDFLRFALQSEELLHSDSRRTLLTRLNGILGSEGMVETVVRLEGCIYLVRRRFQPIFDSKASEVIGCGAPPEAFRFQDEQLTPVDEFHFDIEAYEQGRIHDLRGDLSRQLEMLDEFAGRGTYRVNRQSAVDALTRNASELAPLYQEREELATKVKELPALKDELKKKQQYLPGDDEKRWEAAAKIAGRLERVGTLLTAALRELAQPPSEVDSALLKSFSVKRPDADTTGVAEEKLLEAWKTAVGTGLLRLSEHRQSLEGTVKALVAEVDAHKGNWKDRQTAHEAEVGARLASIGVESPMGVVTRVRELQETVAAIEGETLPRLKEVEEALGALETSRAALLQSLRDLDAGVREARQKKAAELSIALERRIKVEIDPAGDRHAYAAVLNSLCDQLATRESQIKNRDSQLERVCGALLPIELSEMLRSVTSKGDASLTKRAGITENTARVLARITENVIWQNALETVEVPDRLTIFVRRYGEESYSELSSGLSPGEQSAALLSLALETRGMPLLIDQPEDELGYRFVVHLVVPKLLRAKFNRQIVVVTHNANVPVLGDADYVLRMENQPDPPGRRCVVAVQGCFEAKPVTAAMLELEGGSEAFQYRRHRYGLLERREVSRSITAELPTDSDIDTSNGSAIAKDATRP